MRIHRLALTIAAVALTGAASASAAGVTLVHTYHTQAFVGVTLHGAATAQQQRWLREMRESSPRIAVSIVWGDCPGWDGRAAACADSTSNQLWIKTSHAPLIERRYVLYHELGHFVDYAIGTDAFHAAWQRIMHENAAQGWWQDDGGGFYDNQAERFADSYAACAMYGATFPAADLAGGVVQGDQTIRWTGFDLRTQASLTLYGYAPTPAQQRDVCSLINSATTGG